MPIKLDNLMLLDKKDKKPTRVRIKILKDGKKVRISALTGDEIDA
jgi:large subunit ribosomal protein L24